MNSDNSKSLIDKIFKMLQTIVQKISSQTFLVLIAFVGLIILASIVNPTLIKEWGMYFWLSLFVLALFFDLANRIFRHFKNALRPKPHIKETLEHTSVNLSINIENWEEKYLQRIYDESRFVALGGIESKISDPRQRSVELKSIYVDLLSTDMIASSSSSYLRDPISASILNLVNKHNKLVILGGPGSGKSTFAKFMTLCLSASRLYKDSDDDWLGVLRSEDCNWSHGSLIPVRISLGEFPITEISSQLINKNNKSDLIFSLLSIILEHSGLKGFDKELTEYFKRGNVIVFFDGLDEVIDKTNRTLVAEAIVNFADKYNRCRYVITCRSASYPRNEFEAVEMPWFLNNFMVATLGDLNEERIHKFINAWFDEISRIGRYSQSIGRNKAKHLDDALITRLSLRKIASNPLLLTVMVIVHDHYGELPETKVALYQKCTDLLLWRWEAVKRGLRISDDSQYLDFLNLLDLQRIVKPRDIEKVIYQIVYNAHSQTKNDELAKISSISLKRGISQLLQDAGIPKNNAYEKASNFVDHYIRERVGLFDEQQDGIFVAVHRSFQEYLSARHLCSQRAFTTEAVSLVYQNFDQWREVFLMAVEQQVYEGFAFQAIDAINRLYPEKYLNGNSDIYILVGEAIYAVGLLEMRNDEGAGTRLLDDIQVSFSQIMKDTKLSVAKRAYIGSLLGDIGDQRFKPHLTDEHADSVIFPELITIPSGYFVMGGDDGDSLKSSDSLLFELELEEYQIGKYPITETEYEMFVRANNYSFIPAHWRNNRPPERKTNHPITGVNWMNADDYCKWLTVLLRKKGKISEELVVRLPTEAEWEKAMRWDLQKKKSFIYPWGNEWDSSKCNVNETGLGSTSPVGIFEDAKSSFGLYDGVGNVFEWCNSIADKYPYCVDDGRENHHPQIPESSSTRIARGGSWYTTKRFASCIYRGQMSPGAISPSFGFRVVVAKKVGKDQS